jgi:CelD/BcsL family acetyltransferase involved in cellulose biosynthesis
LRSYKNAAAYEAELGKKSSRNLRRAVNQFQQQGELTFKVMHPSHAGFRDVVNTCISMKSEWLHATGRSTDAVSETGHARFLGDLQGDPASREGAIAFVLAIAGKPIAIELGYLQRGHYFAYMGAFDWSLRNLSPGKLQMHKSICWLIENDVATLDLLANPTDYKQNYTSHVTALQGYVVNLTWRGVGYTAIWTRRVKPVLKAILSRLPYRVRVFILAARKAPYPYGV